MPVIRQLPLSPVRETSSPLGNGGATVQLVREPPPLLVKVMAARSPTVRLAVKASARSGLAGATVMETVAGVASSPDALVAVTV